MRVLLLILAALPSFAQGIQCNGSCDSVFGGSTYFKFPEPSLAWQYSVAFFAGAQAMDTASSWGKIETNPILGRGPFGARQVGLKMSMASGVVLVEWLMLRRHPGTRRAWTWANIVAGGVTVGVSARNWSH